MTAVSTAVDQPTTQILQVHGSVANQDFVATLADGRRVVLKVGPKHEIMAEAWACRKLRRRWMCRCHKSSPSSSAEPIWGIRI